MLETNEWRFSVAEQRKIDTAYYYFHQGAVTSHTPREDIQVPTLVSRSNNLTVTCNMKIQIYVDETTILLLRNNIRTELFVKNRIF